MSSNLTKFLAVARVQTGADGQLLPERPVITFYAANSKDPDIKSYRKRIDMVLKKAADKMQEGKRIKLSSPKDEKPYELYIMSFKVTNSNASLAFFAIVDKQFGVAHSIGRLYDDFKAQFFSAFDSKAILSAKRNGPVHKKSQQMLSGLATKFGSNSVLAATQKVEEVKAVMAKNIEIAIENGQSLEDLEGKAEDMASLGNSYLQESRRVRKHACMEECKAKAMFWGFGLLIVAVIVVVILVMTA